MNNKELLAEIAKRLKITQKDVSAVLEKTVEALSDSLSQGNDVSIQGFGSIEVRKKNERVVVNPSTKKKMIVPPKLVLGFRTSNTYKEKIKNVLPHGK